MSNPRIEAILAKALTEGFMHPGNPEQDIPPTPILLPFKPSPGMPEEMGKLMTGTVKLLSECIVATIENEGDSEIVDKPQAAAMRRAVGDGPDGPMLVPMFCRCDTNRTNPLAVFTVTDPNSIIVEGRTFLRGLHKRAEQCPHGFTTELTEAEELRSVIDSTIESLPKRDVTTKGRTIIAKAVDEFMGGA